MGLLISGWLVALWVSCWCGVGVGVARSIGVCVVGEWLADILLILLFSGDLLGVELVDIDLLCLVLLGG